MIDYYWLLEIFDRNNIVYVKDRLDDITVNLIVTREKCLPNPYVFHFVDDTLTTVSCGDSTVVIDKKCDAKYHAGLLKIFKLEYGYYPEIQYTGQYEDWVLGVPI